jgi:L-fuculose-phosphate aldolase
MPRAAVSSEALLRRDVVETCRRLHARDLIGAGEGNVSCRLGRDRFLVTPSGASKAYLRPPELVVVSAYEAVAGPRPSCACTSPPTAHGRR